MMKRFRKMISVALALVMCLSVAIPVFAGDYESSKLPCTVNGRSYQYWSELMTRSPNTGLAWVSEANYNSTNLTAGCLGAKARVYDKNGNLLAESDMNYTTTAIYYMVAGVDVYSSDTIYSQGKVEIYNGVNYTKFDCPMTAKVPGGARSYAHLSEDVIETAAPYKVNAKGETYGSSMFSEKNGGNPDLISAVGNNGLSGYVRDDDLNFSVNTPMEALVFQKNMPSTRTIPLYDLEGNVIDSFTVDNTYTQSEELQQQLAAMDEKHQQVVKAAIRSRSEEYVPVVGYTADGEPVEGYASQQALDGPKVHNPEEAMMYMKNLAGIGYTVPVYDTEGNVIGQFTVQPAKGIESLSQQELPSWLRENKM